MILWRSHVLNGKITSQLASVSHILHVFGPIAWIFFLLFIFSAYIQQKNHYFWYPHARCLGVCWSLRRNTRRETRAYCNSQRLVPSRSVDLQLYQDLCWWHNFFLFFFLLKRILKCSPTLNWLLPILGFCGCSSPIYFVFLCKWILPKLIHVSFKHLIKCLTLARILQIFD